MKRVTVLVLLLAGPAAAEAAFTDTGQVNPEILRTDPAIMGWATGVADVDRGPVDYLNPGLGDASFGLPGDVLGPAGSVCSLGDGGFITLTFDAPIRNGAGADFAVFENGFAFSGLVYMEIGFVEVSSDGIVFSRLPAICRKTAATASFDGSLSADFYNLAGNFAGGTGIDLEDLVTAGDANVTGGLVNLDNITHVRLVDVIGHVASGGATQDYFGAAVSDPWPTAFASGGMDVTGVAVLNEASPIAVQSSSWSQVKALYGR